MMRCFLTALAGAVVVFIWSAVSWMVLPWHNWEIKSFHNDGQMVTQAIAQEASETGIYLLPNMVLEMAKDPAKQKAWQEKAQKGPLVYMSVNPQGVHWDMATSMLIQFMIQFIIAAFAACLVAKTSLSHMFTKAAFISLTVSLGAFLMTASSWNWWGFPLKTIWINVPDVAIGWFLGGLAIAAMTKSKPTSNSPATA